MVEEVLGIHPSMSELIVRVFLHAAYALLIKKLGIVAGIAIEEIVSTHAKPEEVYLAVRLLRIIIYVRNIR